MARDFVEETTLEFDFDQSVGYWVISAAQAFQKAFNSEVAPHGITFRQSQVLGWLAMEGELSQTDLAARMMIEPPTLVGVLDRMERDGLICREVCSADRRRNMIRVNRGAEVVWAKVVECAHRVRGRATEGIGAEQVASLIAMLQQIMTNLSDSGSHYGSPSPLPGAVDESIG